MATRNQRYLHGVPRLLVLKLLDGQEMYGYELGRALRESTGDVISLGEGVIYPLLHELEAEGLVRSRRAKTAGRPRVYYRLTPKGRRRLNRDAGTWWSIAQAVAGVLNAGEQPTGDPDALLG